MANILAPFGFSQRSGIGSAPTYEQSSMLIAYNNTTPIYFGDAVQPVTSTATGYIQQATAATTVTLAGIFVGCTYLSVSQKRTVWSNYWPGSDVASGNDVTAYVVNDPNATFLVQTNNSAGSATAVTNAKIGQLISLAGTAGNAASGISAMYADQNTIGTTDTLSFRIISTVVDPPGANGTDITTAFNYIVVGFNNVLTRSTGAQTGIS